MGRGNQLFGLVPTPSQTGAERVLRLRRTPLSVEIVPLPSLSPPFQTVMRYVHFSPMRTVFHELLKIGYRKNTQRANLTLS